jgi:hypothetical protein
VGVDSLAGGVTAGGKSASPKVGNGIPDARQLDDDQIEAIIKKLQMAQTEAPQIIAALFQKLYGAAALMANEMTNGTNKQTRGRKEQNERKLLMRRRPPPPKIITHFLNLKCTPLHLVC